MLCIVWCVSILIIELPIFVLSSQRKNVCRTFADYATIETNKNCWFNPDVGASPSLIAKRYGYPLKMYKLTTEDGYILTLIRIPHNGSDSNLTRQPVLLQHGIAANGLFWMLRGPKSLAFVLADNGFDVWLSTTRGAGHSRKHTYLTTEDPSYWNFGLHEVALYDLSANIEFISNITGQRGNIIYIGHSMGSTISYIYSSVRKSHAESNLKSIISLSPVAYLKHIEGWHKMIVPFAEIAVQFLQNLGIKYVGGTPIINDLVYHYCGKYPYILLCKAIVICITGLAPEQIQPDLFPGLAKMYPAGTSLKVVQHYIQMILSGGKFQHYDYKFENPAVYKSFEQPIYDVTNISLPVYLFIGHQDVIANERDVDILYSKLNSPERKSKASKYFFNFAHNDFFMGADVKEFYNVLLDVMKTKIGNK